VCVCAYVCVRERACVRVCVCVVSLMYIFAKYQNNSKLEE